MKKPGILLSCLLLLFKYVYQAQNISGIINHYASVKNISGADISVSTATAFNTGDNILLIQMKGAAIDQNNTPSFGNINSVGGAGTYEFLTVSSVSGTVITLVSAPVYTYNYASGWVQAVRVPKYCTPIVTNTITCAAWNSTTGVGGIIALEANTLTLNSDINASEKGFNGGTVTIGSFSCDVGDFAVASGLKGGKKGESISAYISGLDGSKGKQANGGGGSNPGNSGGGGGGHAGAGGFGGEQYSECDSTTIERGVGGLGLGVSLSTLFMGGGGGGGFKDNGFPASKGSNGGGIIYIKANAIVSNNRAIVANGGNVTLVADAEGNGGGGAGGSIFLACPNISGNLAVETNGGDGGSNNNTVYVMDCHGPGGGGGGGVFAHSYPNLPSNITYSCEGGDAGTVNCTVSVCFGTTHGATHGADGDTLPNLPATPVALNNTPLNITQSASAICIGESASITATGGIHYNWSPGSTNSVIVVSPTLNTIYTATATNGASSCESVASATITVDPCVGINNHPANNSGLNVYPNPAKDNLYLETTSPVKIMITDGAGRLVLERSLQKGKHELDLGGFAPGVYTIKTNNNSGTSVTRLIKTD